MGRSGSALALLLPNESSYVEFLRLRKVPLVEAQLLQGAQLLSKAKCTVYDVLQQLC
jgi:hypothetical protein